MRSSPCLSVVGALLVLGGRRPLGQCGIKSQGREQPNEDRAPLGRQFVDRAGFLSGRRAVAGLLHSASAARLSGSDSKHSAGVSPSSAPILTRRSSWSVGLVPLSEALSMLGGMPWSI